MEDGDEAFDMYTRDEEDSDSEIQYKELNLDMLALEAEEVIFILTKVANQINVILKFQPDDSGTIASSNRLTEDSQGNAETSTANGTEAVPINENLFLEEDLDGLEDELNDLDIDE